MKRRTQLFWSTAAVALVLISSGNTPLSSGDGRILTVVSRSASISWTGDAPATTRRAKKREVAAVRRRIEQDRAGTYIAEVVEQHDSSLSRWPDRRDKPIRVWIQSAVDLEGFSDTLEREVQNAFWGWQEVGLPLTFGFVRDSADAEVHVQFIEQFDEPISGSTLWARDQNWWIANGRITIALRNYNGNRLSPLAVRAIALHEVGHLLGLDHTADSLSIMAPRVRVKALSDSDRATMSLLYSLPAGNLR